MQRRATRAISRSRADIFGGSSFRIGSLVCIAALLLSHGYLSQYTKQMQYLQ
jgi:hypothetical protein